MCKDAKLSCRGNIRRIDFPSVIEALQSVGFVHQNIAGVDMFLDGPEGSVRSAVHIIFASEKVHSDYVAPMPEVTESEAGPDFPVPHTPNLRHVVQKYRIL